jgi:predicted transcriptional regulator
MRLKTKPLGELEQLIMNIVWQHDCATVRCVYDALKQQRDLAYTTVMTTMDRLTKKGILKRTKVGKAYEYRASQTEAELCQCTNQAIFDMLIRRYGDVAIAQFVDTVDKIDPSKLEELKRLVDEHST